MKHLTHFLALQFKTHKLSFLGFVLTILLFSGCTPEFKLLWLTTTPFLPALSAPDVIQAPQPVTEIPLSGPLSNRNAEFSGLAWYGDYLILLPQWPSHWDNQVFMLHKADIVDFLTGKRPEPLTPQPIPLINGSPLMAQIPGFDGFESIAFHGERVYLTIESKPGANMLSYVVSGTMAPDLSELRLDDTHLAPVEPQTDIDNLGEEAMFITADRVVTIYEANSVFLNPAPVVHLFDPNLNPQGTLPMRDTPYRITDATPLDANQRFWVINYFFPGDQQLLRRLGLPNLGANPLAEDKPVEQLVELQFGPAGVTEVGTPPISLQLQADNVARNWEGIARLETPELNGFLLATDYYPGTIFAFVPKPK
ncbi:MAG: hypothetical protein NT075_19205 [Chloroflexi bacterium]|nr:hypothetical protein [Chloroflexota bacterium]